MKKAVVLALLLAVASLTSFAQQNGIWSAPDYGKWQMATTAAVAAGANPVTVSRTGIADANASCYLDPATGTRGARQFTPLFIGNSITVNDGNAETVTVTAATSTTGSCSFTATFSNAHNAGAPITSGTGGLNEAVYLASLKGGQVLVGSDWGGTTANLIAAVPYPNVTIHDIRYGTPQFWNVTPAGTTVLATPAVLTGQAACDGTHQFCSDASVAGSASWGGAIYCGVTYVDIMGNESLTSVTNTFTSVASKAIDIASPAASAGAVGWKPYCSVSGGTYALMYSIPLVTQPSAVGSYPVSNGVCTLTTLQTTTPACAITNATYGQTASVVGKSTLFNGGAQITGYPVVTSMLAPNLDSASAQSLNPSNGGLTTYKYVPSNRVGLPGVNSNFMAFPITTAAQTTIGQVAGSIPLPPGFMNYAGRTIEVCGMLSKTSTTADTITNIQLWWDAEGSNVTAGTAVQLSNIQITQTLTAAANISFCQDITTTVAAATATGGTILPGLGWLTESQTSAGTIHAASTNNLFAAVGSLNLALNAKLEVVYNHTTGTDGAGVVLINPTVRILN